MLVEVVILLSAARRRSEFRLLGLSGTRCSRGSGGDAYLKDPSFPFLFHGQSSKEELCKAYVLEREEYSAISIEHRAHQPSAFFVRVSPTARARIAVIGAVSTLCQVLRNTDMHTPKR